MYLPVTFVFVCLILYFTKSPQFLLSVMQWFIHDHPLIILLYWSIRIFNQYPPIAQTSQPFKKIIPCKLTNGALPACIIALVSKFCHHQDSWLVLWLYICPYWVKGLSNPYFILFSCWSREEKHHFNINGFAKLSLPFMHRFEGTKKGLITLHLQTK